MLIPAIAQADDRLVGMASTSDLKSPACIGNEEKPAVFLCLPQLTSAVYITHTSNFLPFFSNSFNSSESWYEQCLTETTGTSHNLLITPYPPSQNHSMTLGATGIFHPTLDLSGLLPSPSELLTWPCGIILWTLGAPFNLHFHMALPLLTNSWSHLRSESLS